MQVSPQESYQNTKWFEPGQSTVEGRRTRSELAHDHSRVRCDLGFTNNIPMISSPSLCHIKGQIKVCLRQGNSVYSRILLSYTLAL